MLVRFRADVIKLKPKVVVILAGTNDIAENTGPVTLEMIEDNIISMAQMAKINGIKVILCSVLPVYDYPWKPGLEPADKIISLNSMLKGDAERDGMIYVDYFSAMVDDRKGMKAEYSEDGVHPNESGYKIMEPLVEEAIIKALNQLK
jgi:lysophospholipase L1-like esterase